MATGTFVRIRAGIFFVADGHAERLVDIVDRSYWSIVRKIILAEVGREYAVGGRKACELALRDYSPADTLLVHTRDIDRTVRVAEGFSIRFRAVAAKSGVRSAFATLMTGSESVETDGGALRVLSEEASILDCLLDKTDTDHGVAMRFLRKYHSYLDRDRLGALVRVRYITSVNRLRAIAKSAGYDALYRDCLDVIRREGANCFISVDGSSGRT